MSVWKPTPFFLGCTWCSSRASANKYSWHHLVASYKFNKHNVLQIVKKILIFRMFPWPTLKPVSSLGYWVVSTARAAFQCATLGPDALNIERALCSAYELSQYFPPFPYILSSINLGLSTSIYVYTKKIEITASDNQYFMKILDITRLSTHWFAPNQMWPSDYSH